MPINKDYELDVIREDIGNLISRYCDKTWRGLEKAHFIEYTKDGRGPQDLLDDIINYISRIRGSNPINSTVESLPSKQMLRVRVPSYVIGNEPE